jgi:hypothetical protein
MIRLILWLMCVAYMSCTNQTSNTNSSTQFNVGDATVLTYTIDSCQYIGNLDACHDGWFLTHKGNCVFCHQRNQRK